MTREEAKEALSVLKIYDNQWLREAIDMAIEALSAKPQTDLISRADALEAVDELPTKDTPIELYEVYRMAINDAEWTIDALPSADAVEYESTVTVNSPISISTDAVQGEWIDIDNYYRLATCSHCHKVTMFEKWGEDIKPYNFCPNCGARMKGAEHETD